jgi:N-carbamoylputrescine amidase
MRVAAFQNGYFTALCNRVGKEETLDFSGESFVCGPDGEVIARGPKSEDAIVYADIDLAAAARSNARRLFLKHRRPQLYADWIAR